MAESEDRLLKDKHLSLVYGLLAALGITFYTSWSIMYGTWFDVGVYAVTILMVGFGLIGFLLYSIPEKE